MISRLVNGRALYDSREDRPKSYLWAFQFASNFFTKRDPIPPLRQF